MKIIKQGSQELADKAKYWWAGMRFECGTCKQVIELDRTDKPPTAYICTEGAHSVLSNCDICECTRNHYGIVEYNNDLKYNNNRKHSN